MTDYWIIFSEVTERGDNVGYFIIGTLCFISGLAMGSAKKQEQEIDKLNHKVMQSFRLLLDLAGFEIVGRVTLRHKKSGRIFK